MRQIEKDFLTFVVDDARSLAVEGAVMEDGVYTEINSLGEVQRLFDSDDYRKGWEACHRKFLFALAALVRGEIPDKQMKQLIEKHNRQKKRQE